MQTQRLHQLAPNLEHGIQASHRLLKNHRNRIATNSAHFFVRHLEQVLAHKFDRTGNFSGRLGYQTQNRHGSHGLAATGFTHNGEGLAFINNKAHAIYSAVDTVWCTKVRLKVFNF